MVIGWIGDYEETSLSGVLYIRKKSMGAWYCNGCDANFHLGSVV